MLARMYRVVYRKGVAMEDKLMSATQAAEYLGITRVRINQLAGEGRLKREEVGGYFVYRRSELDRWKALPKNKGGRPKEEAGTLARVFLA